MAYPPILNLPVEFCLEFMTIISPDLADPKWELLDNMVHKVNGVGLRVLFIDFQSTYTCGIIDCGILEATNLLYLFALKVRNLTSIWMW